MTYKGVLISDSKIATRFDQEARVDTTTEDGHTSVLRLRVQEDGAGHYKTSVTVAYDGAEIASTDFLSSPGQSAISENPDLRVTVRVDPGT